MLFNDATTCYEHWPSVRVAIRTGADGLNWDLMNDSQGNPKKYHQEHAARTPRRHRWPREFGRRRRRRSAPIKHILFADRPEAESVAIDAYFRLLEPAPSLDFLSAGVPARRRAGGTVQPPRLRPPPPGALYTDLKMHDVGIAGFATTPIASTRPRSLKSGRTAPYLHDGRYYATIRDLLIQGATASNAAGAARRRSGKSTTFAEYVLVLAMNPSASPNSVCT